MLEKYTSWAHIVIHNSDYTLLMYAKNLLADLGIKATGPHLHMRKGRLFRSPSTGKIYRNKKDIYYIYIGPRSLLGFYKKVGFIIARKQRRLEEALKRRVLLDS